MFDRQAELQAKRDVLRSVGDAVAARLLSRAPVAAPRVPLPAHRRPNVLVPNLRVRQLSDFVRREQPRLTAHDLERAQDAEAVSGAAVAGLAPILSTRAVAILAAAAAICSGVAPFSTPI